MKLTPRNNPLTWLLALALAAVTVLLLANLAVGGAAHEGRPTVVFVDPPRAPSAAEALARDSVTVRATDVYRAGAAKRWLLGGMYREAWFAPVRVPVLRLDTVAGGLTPTDRGGGFQTLSLDLVDPAGQVYTLRSVNKDPDRLVPAWAPYLGIGNVVTDGISAGHPYGALAAAALADVAGVAHMHPRLGYVPLQAALDSFGADFGDRLYWLEYEPEGEVADWLALPRFRRWLDSEDVFAAWRSDSLAAKPDLRALVRARVFDLWLGDWDRHVGQWGWAEYAGPRGETRYYPVPNDRDNVFYGISGVIPLTIAAFERRLRPFGPDVDDLPGLTLNSADFDGAFLYGVGEEVFVEEAASLRAALTDAAVAQAMHVWPDSVYAADGARIAGDLQARRARLVEYARDFYLVIRRRGPVTDLGDD